MSAGTSAARLYARLESEICKCVTDIEQLLMTGFPDARICYSNVWVSFRTIVEINDKIGAVDPKQTITLLVPLAAAYNKLDTLLRSVPTSATNFAAQASQLMIAYAAVLHASIHDMSDEEVPVAALTKVLQPFSLLDLVADLVEQAFDFLQTRPYPPESEEFSQEIFFFHGSLFNTFLTVTKISRIVRMLEGNPALDANMAALLAQGTKYLKRDNLWNLMDKCVNFLVTHKSYGFHGTDEANPFIEAITAIFDLAGSGFCDTTNRKNHTKRMVGVFYNKNYDKCYLKAIEYFAKDKGNGINFEKEDYHIVTLSIITLPFINVGVPDEEKSVPGYREALKYSGSHEVQEKIYKACLKIYKTALGFERKLEKNSRKGDKEEMQQIIVKLYALTASTLGSWGTKRLISTKEGNPYAFNDNGPQEVHPDFVAKWDRLLANSWIKVVQAIEIHGKQSCTEYNALAAWVAVYSLARSALYPYGRVLKGQDLLKLDTNGKSSAVELRFSEIEAIYNMLMYIPALVKCGVTDLYGITLLSSLEQTAKEFVGSLFRSGIFGMRKGDPRYHKVWQMHRKLAVTCLKTAKAYVALPLEAWELLKHFPRMATSAERADCIRGVIDACMLPLFFVTNFDNYFGDNPLDSFSADFTALSLLGIEMLACVPEAVWNTGFHHLKGYDHILQMIDCSRPTLRQVLHSDDPGLATAHRLATEIVKGLLNPGREQRELAGEILGHLTDSAKQTLKGISGLIDDLKSDEGMGDRTIACAAKRARLLSNLPCNCTTCTTVVELEQDEIPSKTCSACNVARYCSSQCQKKDWKTHKVACKALK